MQPKRTTLFCLTRLVIGILTLAAMPAVSQETILHNFGGSGDGFGPVAALIQDAAGHLYGTTTSGGKFSGGTVFELTRARNGTWTEKILHNFGRGKDGSWAVRGLTFDGSGNLYGTTLQGGAFSSGIAFELIRQSSGRWSEKVLHNFGKGKDGWDPGSSLIFDAAGNLYGTTSGGGKFGAGTAFELSPQAAGRWTEKILHHFGSTNDGVMPISRLLFDKAGNLYGTTFAGGAFSVCVEDYEVGCGTVYELIPNGHGGWREKVLHNFDGTDGLNPYGGLTLGASGDLFGTTLAGGTSTGGCRLDQWGGGGIAFQLVVKHNRHWTMTTIYNFCSLQNGTDGIGSPADLVMDSTGALYGTASGGGTANRGVVFKLAPNDNTWTETVLYNFLANGDGGFPSAGVILGMDGNLFGTTNIGGSQNAGIAYAINSQ